QLKYLDCRTMNQHVVIRLQLDRTDFIFTKMATARWGMNRILSREQVGTGTQPINHTEIMPAISRSYFLIMATRERRFLQINSRRRTLLADRLLSISIQMITGRNLQEIRENA